LKIDIREILTLPTNIMIALAIASGISLFSPDLIADQMYITDLRDKYGLFIGIVFIITISILIVNLVYKISTSVRKAKNEKLFYETAGKRLKNLNRYQKAIIFGLYQEDNRTLPLPVYDGAMAELAEHMMVNKIPGEHPVHSMENPRIPHMLQPWVVNELNNSTELRASFKEAYEMQISK